MKWKDLKSNDLLVASRQCGKTFTNLSFMLAYVDWLDRGSPEDEEIPTIEFVKIPVEDASS